MKRILLLLLVCVGPVLAQSNYSSIVSNDFASTPSFSTALNQPGALVGTTNGPVLIIWQESFAPFSSWHDIQTGLCDAAGSQTLVVTGSNVTDSAIYRALVALP